jgi:hypothetical protein
MRPRERAGHNSMARLAPTGHSAPMPMPSAARAIMRNVKLGEKPATKLQIEYQRMESISGVLRPMRSASQPEATAPIKRIQMVTASTAATAVTETPNSPAIGHDEQENSEIEGIEHPSEPRGKPSEPLVLGRLPPPRN